MNPAEYSHFEVVCIARGDHGAVFFEVCDELVRSFYSDMISLLRYDEPWPTDIALKHCDSGVFLGNPAIR